MLFMPPNPIQRFQCHKSDKPISMPPIRELQLWCPKIRNSDRLLLIPWRARDWYQLMTEVNRLRTYGVHRLCGHFHYCSQNFLNTRYPLLEIRWGLMSVGAPCPYSLTTAHRRSGYRPEQGLTHQSDRRLHHSHMDVEVLCENDASYTILVLGHAIKLALGGNHYLVNST